jgi:hypothetical protein
MALFLPWLILRNTKAGEYLNGGEEMKYGMNDELNDIS